MAGCSHDRSQYKYTVGQELHYSEFPSRGAIFIQPFVYHMRRSHENSVVGYEETGPYRFHRAVWILPKYQKNRFLRFHCLAGNGLCRIEAGRCRTFQFMSHISPCTCQECRSYTAIGDVPRRFVPPFPVAGAIDIANRSPASSTWPNCR